MSEENALLVEHVGKVVKITLNPTTWKNPIYYVSALSVFVPLFFIASYGDGK